jgi:hypothetical protein
MERSSTKEARRHHGQGSTAVAWSMLAIYVASVGVGYFLMVVNGIFQDAPANQLGLLLAFSAFMVVGVIIVARRPDNTIGWIFSAIGLQVGTGRDRFGNRHREVSTDGDRDGPQALGTARWGVVSPDRHAVGAGGSSG